LKLKCVDSAKPESIQAESLKNAEDDFKAYLINVIDSPAITHLSKQLGFTTNDLIAEIDGAKVKKEEDPTNPVVACFQNSYKTVGRHFGKEITWEAVLATFKEDSQSHYARSFPKWCKLYLALARMLPSEAACERVFSILKKIMSAERSRMTEENAAAICELRLMMTSALDDPTLTDESEEGAFTRFIDEVCVEDDGEACVRDDGEDENDADDTKKEIGEALSIEVVEEFVLAGLQEFQNDMAKNGGEKCAACNRTVSGRRVAIDHVQCKNQGCGKRYCRTENCLGRAEGFVEDCLDLPQKGDAWECQSCVMKFMHK